MLRMCRNLTTLLITTENSYTTVPLARIDIGSILVDPEIGTYRWSVSTRPTRIRTDFWNDLVGLC